MSGFGCEVGASIDAARAGIPIAEVELPLRHRATGRDARGFLHRGRQLLHALVADLPHPAALLSTPDSDTKAFRLYHADGFVDLARGYHFPGDSRPFAILGARLPLHPHEPTATNSRA